MLINYADISALLWELFLPDPIIFNSTVKRMKVARKKQNAPTRVLPIRKCRTTIVRTPIEVPQKPPKVTKLSQQSTERTSRRYVYTVPYSNRIMVSLVNNPIDAVKKFVNDAIDARIPISKIVEFTMKTFDYNVLMIWGSSPERPANSLNNRMYNLLLDSVRYLAQNRKVIKDAEAREKCLYKLLMQSRFGQ